MGPRQCTVLLGLGLDPRDVAADTYAPVDLGVIDLGACETKGITALACPRARFLLYEGLHRLEVRASIIRAVLRSLPADRRPYIDVAIDTLVEMAIQSRTWSGDHE